MWRFPTASRTIRYRTDDEYGDPRAYGATEIDLAPRCPHCAATALQRWGYASGLRRYRCTACRTFTT